LPVRVDWPVCVAVVVAETVCDPLTTVSKLVVVAVDEAVAEYGPEMLLPVSDEV
jgi:hypothetical protein